MARIVIDSVGDSNSALTYATGTTAVAASANAFAILVNDTDAKITGTLEVPAGTNLGAGLGTNVTFNIQGKSYQLFPFVTNATASNITIADAGVKTAHGTIAQLNEAVYFDRVN